MGRFISADVLLNTCQGISGCNVFAYCGNSPVARRDSSGNAAETVFDIISLGASIADVAVDPTDPWAWASLIGDAIDVVVPCFGGSGEAIRGFKAVADAIRAAESADALMDLTRNTIDTIKDISRSFSEGNTCVYVAYANNTLEYVGITNDFGRRQKEWEDTRDIHKITGYIDRTQAHCIEQTVIAVFGKGENGVLSNIRNSIGSKNRKKYEVFETFFKSLF